MISYWCRILFPGLALIAVLSLMVAASNTVVSEANNGIDTAFLDTEEISTARALVRCRVSEKTRAGTNYTNCSDTCPAGSYSVTVRGPSGSNGQITCGPEDVSIVGCPPGGGEVPCSHSIEITQATAGPLKCWVFKSFINTNRPASTQCKVTPIQ